MELEKVKEFMREEDLENIKADLKISKALDFIVENTKWSKPAAKKPAAKKAAADKADAKTAEEKPKKTTRKKKTEETKSEE